MEKWARVRLDKVYSGAVAEHGSQDEKIHFLEEGPTLHCRMSLHGFISLSSFHTAGKLCRKCFLLFFKKKLSSLKMTRRLPLASQNYKVSPQGPCFNKSGIIKYMYQ